MVSFEQLGPDEQAELSLCWVHFFFLLVYTIGCDKQTEMQWLETSH